MLAVFTSLEACFSSILSIVTMSTDDLASSCLR